MRVHRYTLDTFVKIGLGVEAGAIAENENKFQTAFEVVQQTLTRCHLFGPLKPMYLWLSGFSKHIAYLNSFAHAVIKQQTQRVSGMVWLLFFPSHLLWLLAGGLCVSGCDARVLGALCRTADGATEVRVRPALAHDRAST